MTWGGSKISKVTAQPSSCSPKARVRAIAQAPWRQVQMRGGADAENKLGLAGGCDPTSLGQVRNSLGLGHSGIGVVSRPVRDPDESRVKSRPVGIQGWEGPVQKLAAYPWQCGAGAGSLVLHLLLHLLQHLLHAPQLLILHPDKLLRLSIGSGQWQDGDGALHAAVLG